MNSNSYRRSFLPYILAALMVGVVGGFSTVLGPAFVQDLGLDQSNVTWTSLAQAMSTAAFAPILGRLGDVLGRRRTLLVGVAVYTLGNALSALAPGLGAMLAARFIVGLGTAAIAPLILSYIVTEFPADRVSGGFSLYMLISSGRVVIGPILGSLMLEARGWRAMLWLCTGICAIVFLGCLILPDRLAKAGRRLTGFDWTGAFWVVLFFSLSLCVPSFAQSFGWFSPAFLVTLAAALVSLGGLCYAERRAAQPILPGGFLRRRGFILSVATLFLTQGLMQANMTNTMLFLRQTMPGRTMLSGFSVSVLYFGMALGAALLGPLGDRYEPKAVLTGSLALTGAGCGLMLLFTGRTPVWLLALSLGLLGLGLGGNGTILMRTALWGLAPEQAGAGTGTYGLFRDLSAPFGVAVFVPMFTNRIGALTAAGREVGEAAIEAIGMLAWAELICVAGAVVIVRFLPNILKKEN